MVIRKGVELEEFSFVFDGDLVEKLAKQFLKLVQGHLMFRDIQCYNSEKFVKVVK